MLTASADTPSAVRVIALKPPIVLLLLSLVPLLRSLQSWAARVQRRQQRAGLSWISSVRKVTRHSDQDKMCCYFSVLEKCSGE
jgi:hypothetical protein